MSSTLKRIKNIMSCNVRNFLNKSNKSENDIKEYIRKFESEIGSIKAQLDSVQVEAKRRKRALNECEDSISKMDRYIKRSIEDGNSSDVRLFEEKKEAFTKEKEKLERAYETARMAAERMEEAEKKMTSDIEVLRGRLDNIREMEASVNKGCNKSSINDKLNTLEDEVNRKASEAEGMKEIDDYLNGSSSEDDDLDKLFEELENDNK